ncbi:ATP-binding protein [Magnetospirillum sulfuroxidans]|uniref:histidine kinase n=1 Tax=Magnetospirillum sulfuroxidans TaxID=611300 RepID=A0ABS5ICD1_9PROT|nr:ATP-binding protein [Magnetospirillum sulfuroxidans]MBR9972082.1 PAS domain-containing protein [Magnetospirillum sulfuroxidans]
MTGTGIWLRAKAAWAAFRHPEAIPTRPRPDLDVLLQSVPAVIYARQCHEKSPLTYVSGNVQALLGYQAEEILSMPRFWIEHVHADDRERCLGSLASLPSLGRLEMEYRLRTKDGSWRWLHDECKVIHNADGTPREVVGSCTDVTSRHRSEQALARSETDLRAAQTRLMDALESSDDAFSVFDAEDRLIAFNSHYLSIYPTIADIIRPGVSFEELLRVSAQRSQYLGIGPDAVESWVRERLERHRSPAGPFEQLLEDGRWLEIIEHPTAEGGRVAIRREITHRKKIEAAMRDELAFKQTLINALPYPVFYKNTELVYLGCNDAFAAALGKTAAEIVGKTLMETYGADEATKFRQRDVELLTHGGIQSYETAFRWSDGSLRQIAIVKAPFTDQTGKIIGLIGTIIDQTAQKRAEEKLVQTARLVTLGQIASEVAHEMNQPLSILRMTAENSLERLHQDDIAPQTLAGKLSIMIEQTGRMGEMIAHLRSFAHSEMDERRPFAPLPVIHAAIAFLRQPFQLDDITLSVDMPESCSELNGQANQLEQVVLALLSNARDAVRSQRPPGQRRVSLRLEQGADTLTLSVQDNGGGVHEDLWPRIFAPFFTTKADGNGSGTGLGLSISTNIVAAMEGQISGHNTDDGALFQVSWPCRAQTQTPIVLAGNKPRPTGTERRRILVVDDEPLAVDCITDYLTARGYAVIAAISPLDALELAKADSFDLVLTDQRMPGMDGNVLISHLRDLWPQVPAVMMSGGTMPLPPSGAGPTARLTKPLILEELGRTIDDLLSPSAMTAPAPDVLPAQTTPAPSNSATPAQRLWLMGELTANLAHDFGQPINIIRLNAENVLDNLADNRLNDDRLRRALTSTIEQCQRIQDFAQSLVLATRRPTAPPQRFSVMTVLRHALAGIQDRIRMQGIVFCWHAAAKLPMISGHPARLQVALAGLLDNACDVLATEAMTRHAATPPWQARLTVSCQRAEDRTIAISISDNGPGLPEQVHHNLAGGTVKGLGLPIAMGVIAELGGTIDFIVKTGTTIHIHLPVPPRQLYLNDAAGPVAAEIAVFGWCAVTQPDQAEAALLRGDWQTLAPALHDLNQTAPDLPIIVIGDLTESLSRQTVAAGAMMVIAADSTVSDIAASLDECVPALDYL